MHQKSSINQDNLVRHFAILSVLFSLFIVVYFLYYGVITPPNPGGDSADYHRPLAQLILHWNFFVVPKDVNPFISYPGASEGILALFMLFGIPVNWFCIPGFIILWFLCKKLARHFRVENNLAIIYATAFTSSLSVLRQLFTQSIDVYMAIYFVGIILLLEKPNRSLRYFLLLGFLCGMLIGSKYSGPLYLIVFAGIYMKKMTKYLTLSNIIIFLIPFSVFGLFWYIRNYLIWNNPLYPGFFLGMQGYPTLKVLNNMLFFMTPFEKNGKGLFVIIESLVSEYLLFGLSFIPVLLYGIYGLKNKLLLRNNSLNKVFFIGVVTLLVSLLLPIPTINIISNMRYLFPVFIFFILFVFLLAVKFKRTEVLIYFTVMNMIGFVSYIIYHPKLIIIYFILISVLFIKREQTLGRVVSL